MKFQRLRITGFKSFVDPADLRIEPGLTGVVGPNGCGKSNLLEAIRWTMGESRPKSLRGGGMEDVIFAGTTSRPARDFAEVTLTLDNSSRSAPVGFNDDDVLEVTRRIERGAGSAYRISGRDVRAKDVALLFADAATGAHSPALVSQGRIGAVIAAKPTERRAMLEEAAGIAGLHVRRRDAEQKLRATEANLARLDDLMQQMESQIASLKRQARAAERYRNLSEQIHIAEARLLHIRWLEASRAAEAAREEAARSETLVATAGREQAAAAEAQAQAARRAADLRAAQSHAREALTTLAARQQALASEQAAHERRCRDLASAAATLAEDRSRESALAEDARAALARLEQERAETEARLTGARESVQQLQAHVTEAEKRADATELRMAEAIERQAAAQAQIRLAEAALAQADAQHRRVAGDLERLTRERAALASGDEDAARLLAEAEEAVAALSAEIERLTAQLANIDAARDRAAEALEQGRVEAGRVRAALAALTAERQAVARMAALPASAARSALAQLRVAPGYEKALAGALGDDLDAAVGEADAVRNWQDTTGADGDPALPSGAESLADHVDAPPALSRRLRQIGVVDVDDGSIPLSIGQRLVTRDGVMRRWDGFIARGAGAATAERLVQANRLAAIDAALPAAKAAVEQVETQVTQAEADHRQAREQESQTRAALQKAERDRRQADARLAAERATADRRRARLEDLDQGLTRATAELEAAEKERAEKQKGLAALPPLDDAAAVASAARRDAEAARAALAEARARQGEVLRALGADQDRLVVIDRDTRSWTERAATAAVRGEELADRAHRLEEERQLLETAPPDFTRRQTELEEQANSARAAQLAADSQAAQGEAAAAAADKRLADTNEALAVAREARAGAAARAEAQEARHQEINRQCGERFKCPPPLLPERIGFDPVAAVNAEAASAALDRLVMERERLGPVNLVADRELAEIEKGRSDSAVERDELTQAIQQLRGSIASLNREGRARLLAAFEEVDRHFRQLFTTLFQGGQAHLALVDSDDPLEAGLEIMAEPPGKKLTTLTLLSGGEQALTAVALVFGLFLTNPAPICVLDEVDAPLDDANVERFCDLLDRMAQETDTRFLIVTHNAVTMSRMHRLYGVTMVERGVSRLVSVDLRGAETLLAAE